MNEETMTDTTEKQTYPSVVEAEIYDENGKLEISTPDPHYNGSTPGRPTFSERFVTASIERTLRESFPGLEAWTVDAENGKVGNTVVLHMPDDDEGHGLIITVREVHDVSQAGPVSDGR